MEYIESRKGEVGRGLHKLGGIEWAAQLEFVYVLTEFFRETGCTMLFCDGCKALLLDRRVLGEDNADFGVGAARPMGSTAGTRARSALDIRLIVAPLIRKNLIYLIGLFKAQKDAKAKKDVKCN